MCDRFHALPNPGGIFQQDRTHVRIISGMLGVIDEFQEEEAEKARIRTEAKSGANR